MGGLDRAAPGRRLSAALSVAVFLAYFDRSMPGAGAVLLKRELGLSDAALGFAIATAAAIAYAMVAIGVAIAGERGRARWRRAALLGGMVLWTMGAAALAWVRSFGGLVGAEIAIGAGQALFAPAAVTMIADAAPRDALARAMTRYTLASTSGRTGAMLIAGALIAAIAATGWVVPGVAAPWRAIFLISAIPNGVMIVAIAGLVAPGPSASSGVEKSGPSTSSGRTVAEASVPQPGWRRLTGGFATAVAPILVIQSIGIWYPTLLVRLGGWRAADAAMAAGGATLIAALAGQWLGARWIDRHAVSRRAPVVVNGGAILIAGLAIGGSVRFGTGWAVAGLAMADAALGVATVASLAAIQLIVPPGSRRRGNGLFFAVVTLIGAGLGPLLTGLISDTGGASGTTLANGLVAVAVTALALAIGGHLLGGRSIGYRTVRAALTD
jgi:MFS family permease